MIDSAQGPLMVDPRQIERNPNNPRRYFNDERLDLLRTSIQEVGVLVPLIVYRKPDKADAFVLMDGERRWSSALDLALAAVPVSLIPAPSPEENLLRMFNIHAVREEWPLVSIALSLGEVIELTAENREGRLAEMTGLPRGTVRRAKRLLSLPRQELGLIQEEAHLDRVDQVHREDLYLEIDAAESVIRNELPEIARRYSRDEVIRQFARKREVGALRSVTEFRLVGKLIKAAQADEMDRDALLGHVAELIENESLTPAALFEDVGSVAYQYRSLTRRIELLTEDLSALSGESQSEGLARALTVLREQIDRILGPANE